MSKDQDESLEGDLDRAAEVELEEDSDFKDLHNFYECVHEKVDQEPRKAKDKTKDGLMLLPHMLPLKFGNALLLQTHHAGPDIQAGTQESEKMETPSLAGLKSAVIFLLDRV